MWDQAGENRPEISAAGEAMLVSEGVQGSSELPLCSAVPGNSPVLSLTTMGLGQTRSTVPQGWLLNPALPRRELVTAQRRPHSLRPEPQLQRRALPPANKNWPPLLRPQVYTRPSLSLLSGQRPSPGWKPFSPTLITSSCLPPVCPRPSGKGT